jgi:hypothetical protein
MLNKAQHKALSVTLRTVEQRLLEIERLVGTDDYSGILCAWKNNVHASKREAFSEKIALAKEKIRAIAEHFSLDKTVIQAGEHFPAELSYCWEVLQGVKAKRLDKYGEVPPDVEPALDPGLTEIIKLVLEMQGLLQGR